jgi:hypothetical protein
MPFTQLMNTLNFNLANGASSTVPHLLQQYGTPVAPDLVVVPFGVDVVVTASTIQLTNNSGGALVFTCFVERWHTLIRQLGLPAGLSTSPFVIYMGTAGGGGGGGSGTGFVPQAATDFPTTTDPSGVGIFVNPTATGAADDGDPGTPKLTIQGALDCVLGDNDNTVWNIFVAGGAYDEDLVMPDFGCQVNLIAFGRVTLGTGDQADGTSTVPRNVTWAGAEAGVPSNFTFTSMSGFTGLSSGDALNGAGWRISGNVNCTSDTAVLYALFANTRIEGNVIGASTVTGNVNWTMRNCYVEGTFNVDALDNVRYMQDCQFDGTWDAFDVGAMVNCDISGAVTIGTNSNGGDWLNCRLTAFSQTSGGETAVLARFDRNTAAYIANAAAADVGFTPYSSATPVGTFGAQDIGAAIGTVSLPPGYFPTAPSTIVASIILPSRPCFLVQVTGETTGTAPDTEAITVEVLINGVVATSDVMTADGDTLVSVLNPCIHVPAAAEVAVRVIKPTNITDGNVQITITPYIY